MNLAVVITGKINIIFPDTNKFIKLLYHIIKNYGNNVLFIFVVNSNDDQYYNHINELFSYTQKKIIINYHKDYLNELNVIMKLKQNDNDYIRLKERFKNQKSGSLYEFKNFDDPDNDLSSQIQFHQLQVGLKALIEYETKNNIKYDLIMKTRFDIEYPDKFYPHLNDNIFLYFNEINKQIIQTSFLKCNINSIDDLIQYNNSKKLKLPDFRIYDKDERNLSFGGIYYHNTRNLEKIKNGCKDFIYCFNDYFYFGKAELIYKLYNLINESLLIEPDDQELFNSFYCPETQFITYCNKKDINFLMYYNDSFSIVRQLEFIYNVRYD